jgi:ElaB/YqjD/DUF883 family membrane-anchored ribosome-binding protein
MAEKPEVIQQELEQTRHDLAEKLEQIGEKISGTVDTVTQTVSNVTDTVSSMTEAVEGTVQNVAQAVSGTVESVKETVESVGESASETVESLKHAFNLSEQVQKHPWLCFGGSVAVGFIGGKFLVPRRSRTSEVESFVRGGYSAGPAETQERQPATDRDRSQDHGASRAEETTGTGSSSWLGSVLQHFGGEVNKLKGLALGTLFGVVRDMVSQNLPESLKDQVVHLINDVTEKVGGETIQGKVLDENSSESGHQSEPDKGAEHEQSNPTALDRPMGAAERKSKAAVAQSH